MTPPKALSGILISSLFAFALAGCASTESASTSNNAVDETPSSSAPVPAPAYSGAGSLPSQVLADGECGLFLWTRQTPRTFIFFSRAGTGEAKVSDEGTERVVSQTSSGDGLFGQFSQTMRFESATGESWTTHITPGEDIDGGQRIASARLVHIDAEGWQTVIPVVGVRACKAV